MIAMTRGKQVEGLPAIDRFERARVQHINRVRRFRVRVDFAEVPGALTEPPIVIHLRPFLAAIFRAENAAFLRFDDRVDAVRVSAGNRDPDAPENSLRKPISL